MWWTTPWWKHTSLNTEERTYYETLVIPTNRCIYLKDRNAPPISTQDLPQRVIDKIKVLCAERLLDKQALAETAKAWSAEYWQFFLIIQVWCALRATLRILTSNKSSVPKSQWQPDQVSATGCFTSWLTSSLGWHSDWPDCWIWRSSQSQDLGRAS